KNSRNMLYIISLHFRHIYQSVTANRPFCPLFSQKQRRFPPKYSPFRQFSQPLSTHLAPTQTLFQNLESPPSNSLLKPQMRLPCISYRAKEIPLVNPCIAGSMANSSIGQIL
ncbi:MAG: hypothetical protein ABR907_14295, partial [Terracidiphilus sp.]